MLAPTNTRHGTQPCALEDAKPLLITDDHDVSGDGSVVIIQAPGHTSGHTVLLVWLPEAGSILLSGDLWHQAGSRRGRRMPMYNTSRAQTLASMDRVEGLVAGNGARVIVQHELAGCQSLTGSPSGLR